MVHQQQSDCIFNLILNLVILINILLWTIFYGHLFVNFGVCFSNHGDVRRKGSVTLFHINYGNIY